MFVVFIQGLIQDFSDGVAKEKWRAFYTVGNTSRRATGGESAGGCLTPSCRGRRVSPKIEGTFVANGAAMTLLAAPLYQSMTCVR